MMNSEPIPFELIDRYLSGELNPEEQAAFEERLREDRELQESLAHLQAMESGLSVSPEQLAADPLWKTYQNVREAGEQWKQTQAARSNSRTIPLRWFAGAAAVVVFFLLGYWLFRPAPQTDWEQLALAEFEVYPNKFGMETVRAVDPDSADFVQMMRWYRTEQYDSSLISMDVWLTAFPDSNHLQIYPCEIQFYRGQVHWQLAQTKLAISDWRSVIGQDCRRFVPEAEWYLALGYMRLTNEDSTRYFLQKIIEQETHPNLVQAQEVWRAIQ